MDSKKRGQAHYRNKFRFKDKSKVIPKPNAKENLDVPNQSAKSTNRLGSNWDRYEEEIQQENEESCISTDFSQLVQAPISVGGHFQFKSDKKAESDFDFDKMQQNKMFSLDLHVLQSSLNTIPFHRRCGLDESYLTDGQLQEIESRACQNRIQYENYLKLNAIMKEPSEQGFSTNEDTELSRVLDAIDVNKDAADENKSVTVESSNSQADIKDGREQLEEWLDDILDD